MRHIYQVHGFVPYESCSTDYFTDTVEKAWKYLAEARIGGGGHYEYEDPWQVPVKTELDHITTEELLMILNGEWFTEITTT